MCFVGRGAARYGQLARRSPVGNYRSDPSHLPPGVLNEAVEVRRTQHPQFGLRVPRHTGWRPDAECECNGILRDNQDDAWLTEFLAGRAPKRRTCCRPDRRRELHVRVGPYDVAGAQIKELVQRDHHPILLLEVELVGAGQRENGLRSDVLAEQKVEVVEGTSDERPQDIDRVVAGRGRDRWELEEVGIDPGHARDDHLRRDNYECTHRRVRK